MNFRLIHLPNLRIPLEADLWTPYKGQPSITTKMKSFKVSLIIDKSRSWLSDSLSLQVHVVQWVKPHSQSVKIMCFLCFCVMYCHLKVQLGACFVPRIQIKSNLVCSPFSFLWIFCYCLGKTLRPSLCYCFQPFCLIPSCSSTLKWLMFWSFKSTIKDKHWKHFRRKLHYQDHFPTEQN